MYELYRALYIKRYYEIYATHHEQDTSIFGSYAAASEPATDDSQHTCDDQGVGQSGIRRRGHKGHVAVLCYHRPDTDAAHHQAGQLQHEQEILDFNLAVA